MIVASSGFNQTQSSILSQAAPGPMNNNLLIRVDDR